MPISLAAPFDELSPPPKPELPSGEAEPQPPTREPPLIVEEEAESTAMVAAVQAFKSGDLAACMSHLRDAVAERPTLPPPKLILAGFHMAVGQQAQGRQLLEELAGGSTKRPEMYLAFARMALAEGRLADAELHFDKAEALGPPLGASDAQKAMLAGAIIGGRIDVAEARRNWALAESLLAEQVKLQPDNALLRGRWGIALFRTGKEDDAFEQLDIAWRQDKTQFPPEIALATLCVQNGDFPGADRWYGAAAKQHTKNGRVLHEWATARLLQGDAAEAERLANRAAELGEASLELDLLRGTAARQLGKWVEAQKLLEGVLKKEPQTEQACYQLVMTLAATKKFDEAQKLIDARRQMVPSSPWLLAAAGWLDQCQGKSASAEAMLVEAAAAHPELLYLLGRCFQATKNGRDARAVAEQLQPQLDAPSIFAMRAEAKRWVEEIREQPPATETSPQESSIDESSVTP